MHMQCCDITYDVTVSLNDVTLTNKMMCFRCGVSQACLFKNTPKMAVIDMIYAIGSTQIAGCKARCHTLPCVFGHVPMTGAYNHFIYLHFI